MIEKYQQEDNIETIESSGAELLLYNDDFNTFDHVIECLIAICDYTAMQAEQYAVLVHYKGKASIKQGAYEDLLPIHNTLANYNLTVELKK